MCFSCKTTLMHLHCLWKVLAKLMILENLMFLFSKANEMETKLLSPDTPQRGGKKKPKKNSKCWPLYKRK